MRLRKLEPEGGGALWAKWEGANPTGSMKDRMAVGMVAHGEATGALRPGMRVVEYTGGSTGSSLAMVCAARGYRAHLVTADCFAVEKIRDDACLRRRGRGARERRRPGDSRALRPVQGADRRAGGGARHVVGRAVRQSGQRIGVRGARRGDPRRARCRRRLRYRGRQRRLLLRRGGGAEAAQPGGPVRRDRAGRVAQPSGRALGGHRLEGIGVGFVPPGLRLDLADRIDAIERRRRLRDGPRGRAPRGLAAGQTSGANVVAARRLAADLGPGSRVVTVLVDTGLKSSRASSTATDRVSPRACPGRLGSEYSGRMPQMRSVWPLLDEESRLPAATSSTSPAPRPAGTTPTPTRPARPARAGRCLLARRRPPAARGGGDAPRARGRGAGGRRHRRLRP